MLSEVLEHPMNLRHKKLENLLCAGQELNNEGLALLSEKWKMLMSPNGIKNHVVSLRWRHTKHFSLLILPRRPLGYWYRLEESHT